MDKLKCVSCRKWMKPTKLLIEGFQVKGWECKCGTKIVDTLDAQRILAYNKIKKERLKARVTQAGNSMAIRIPKQVVEAYCLKKGEELSLIFKNPKRLVVEVTV